MRVNNKSIKTTNVYDFFANQQKYMIVVVPLKNQKVFNHFSVFGKRITEMAMAERCNSTKTSGRLKKPKKSSLPSQRNPSGMPAVPIRTRHFAPLRF